MFISEVGGELGREGWVVTFVRVGLKPPRPILGIAVRSEGEERGRDGGGSGPCDVSVRSKGLLVCVATLVSVCTAVVVMPNGTFRKA